MKLSRSLFDKLFITVEMGRNSFRPTGETHLDYHTGDPIFSWKGVPFRATPTYDSNTPKGWRTDFTFYGTGWQITLRITNTWVPSYFRKVHWNDISRRCHKSTDGYDRISYTFLNFHGDVNRYEEDLMTATLAL